MLEREHLAGAGKAGLDLVGDEQNAMLVAQRPQAPHEIERGDVEAALSLHRLDDDGGDARRVGVVFEQRLQRVEALLAADPVIGVREGDVIDVGGNGPKPFL